MSPSRKPWESRVHRTVVIGQWVALAIGIVSDFVATSGSSSSFTALILASLYVIGSTLLPEHLYRARFGVESITLLGSLLLLVVLTLTGGPSSPYLLLSMGPPIFATIYGGLRSGFTTGLLSAGLLVLVTLAAGQMFIDAAPATALYLVFVLLVGAIRQLLDDIHQTAAELEIEKESATQQLEKLEQIHGALTRLSEDVSAGRLNAVEVGADTLDTILERFPGSAGKLGIMGDDGIVVLAARGIPVENGHVYNLPLSTSDMEVGSLELTTPDALDEARLEEVVAILNPVSLAFANLRLLQEIVGSAVTEERMRLAREMHDEIGPSLA
ncbi:MAG: hypothetical protein WBM90_12145, partial [Acidimicrobiia bacterium]